MDNSTSRECQEFEAAVDDLYSLTGSRAYERLVSVISNCKVYWTTDLASEPKVSKGISGHRKDITYIFPYTFPFNGKVCGCGSQ